jgi:hypothetical protein
MVSSSPESEYSEPELETPTQKASLKIELGTNQFQPEGSDISQSLPVEFLPIHALAPGSVWAHPAQNHVPLLNADSPFEGELAEPAPDGPCAFQSCQCKGVSDVNSSCAITQATYIEKISVSASSS